MTRILAEGCASFIAGAAVVGLILLAMGGCTQRPLPDYRLVAYCRYGPDVYATPGGGWVSGDIRDPAEMTPIAAGAKLRDICK